MQVLTPDEWLDTDEFKGIIIMDPDGWDRRNFEESWNTPIDKHEFLCRLSQCTLTLSLKQAEAYERDQYSTNFS